MKVSYMFFFLATLALASSAPAAAPLDAVPQTRLESDLRCHLGSYSLPAGKSVVITGDSGRARALQYTLSGEKFGTLQEHGPRSFRSDSVRIDFGPCSTGSLSFVQGGIVQQGQRENLVQRETSFISDGIPLHGKLVLPQNGRARWVVVWIEGSNNNPSTDDTIWQYELARRGIGVFVYDKRGTGLSGGSLNSDFQARARDTAAAVREVRKLIPSARKIGVIGGSQGGWVAPLTATLVDLDFVIPAFALAQSPIAQDQQLVAQQLIDAGYDAPTLQKAKELTDITARIVRSDMKDGLTDLDAFKVANANAQWLKAIQPKSYTGLFLLFSSEVIKTNGPALAQGMRFDYEPRPIIETVKPRQLWLLAGRDKQAPNAGSQDILRQVQRRRRDVFVVVFPKADHGLVEVSHQNGRTETGFSPRLFDITAAWIKHSTIPGQTAFTVLTD
jgi:uncharacterized protein